LILNQPALRLSGVIIVGCGSSDSGGSLGALGKQRAHAINLAVVSETGTVVSARSNPEHPTKTNKMPIG